MIITQVSDLDGSLYGMVEGTVYRTPDGYIVNNGNKKVEIDVCVEISQKVSGGWQRKIVTCSYYIASDASDDKQAIEMLIESLAYNERVVAWGKFLPHQISDRRKKQSGMIGILQVSSLIVPSRLSKLCLANLDWTNNAKFTMVENTAPQPKKKPTTRTRKKKTQTTDEYLFD